jgi:hypothetical protein
MLSAKNKQSLASCCVSVVILEMEILRRTIDQSSGDFGVQKTKLPTRRAGAATRHENDRSAFQLERSNAVAFILRACSRSNEVLLP